MVESLEMKVTVKTQENIAERLEKEVTAAWRAGYSYLYVAPDIEPKTTDSRTEVNMSVSYKVLPTERQLNHNPFDVSMEEYDLTELTVEKIQEFKS